MAVLPHGMVPVPSAVRSLPAHRSLHLQYSRGVECEQKRSGIKKKFFAMSGEILSQVAQGRVQRQRCLQSTVTGQGDKTSH